MKKLVAVCSLLLANQAFAARLAIPSGRAPQPVASERKAQVLREARGVFRLADGSEWITHPAPAKNEPSAIAVTRFGRDGSPRAFLLSDWLPKGTLPGGWCGQIYAVTSLTDGRVAVSAGWHVRGQSHNAILVLRPREDGGYDTDRVIEVPGVARIVGGPRNTILAITKDSSKRAGGPLVSIFEPDGVLTGALESHGVEDVSQNAFAARLQRISEHRFAVYNPGEQRVVIFDIHPFARGANITPINDFFVGDDRALSALPILDIDATLDNDLLVVRSGVLNGKIGTHLTVYGYGPNRPIKEAVTLDRPWNYVISDGKGQIQGVVFRGGVELDTIEFRRDAPHGR